MGIANSIPGVSGGTIAFIFGIYEDLIVAINSIDITLVKYIFKRQWSQVRDHIPRRFLIFIFGCAILAIFSFPTSCFFTQVVFQNVNNKPSTPAKGR